MWAQIINILLGLWVMTSPAVMHYNQTLANNNHVAGPLIVTFATIALWDINRNVRLANVLTGAWLVVSLFILPVTIAAIISNGVAGLLIIIFSMVKGKTVHSYGGGWRSLFQKHPPHIRAAEKESTAH